MQNVLSRPTYKIWVGYCLKTIHRPIPMSEDHFKWVIYVNKLVLLSSGETWPENSIAPIAIRTWEPIETFG